MVMLGVLGTVDGSRGDAALPAAGVAAVALAEAGAVLIVDGG